ncbi:hypothetical protein HMPREF3159_07935 [Brachybacterium sp. HMSC06H03]|uniref:hypothetical protein n=1 Tax=Brachybacterium sp. HMSC06H03 TaxID=1581127 RepID=UPI0008A5649B|nr:hypothetical protein [Brachybacterium sp. HMSC06H03]OFT58146.1 hypothetical protein HMPREF3159_07935 [Brachybacterium sp. HMSC06H03]
MTSETVRIYCEDPSPFHEKHGRTWHATFTRDDLGNWEYVPVQRSRRAPVRTADPGMGNARSPQHSYHYDGRVIDRIGDQMHDLHPLGVPEESSAPAAVRSASITYNWPCRCGASLSVSSARLRPALEAFIEHGTREVSLALLRRAVTATR